MTAGTAEKLQSLMADVDDFDPEDAAAERRSAIAKHLSAAAWMLEKGWMKESEAVGKLAIRILEGN